MGREGYDSPACAVVAIARKSVAMNLSGFIGLQRGKGFTLSLRNATPDALD
jgi:hypothetical protein